jgi:hypothetical protein
MDKPYRKIEFNIGSSVEDAVNKLLDYKKINEYVCGELDGVTLYSDTVTMDEAYKNITGKTKSEFDRSQEEWKERYERELREFENGWNTMKKFYDEFVIEIEKYYLKAGKP